MRKKRDEYVLLPDGGQKEPLEEPEETEDADAGDLKELNKTLRSVADLTQEQIDLLHKAIAQQEEDKAKPGNKADEPAKIVTVNRPDLTGENKSGIRGIRKIMNLPARLLNDGEKELQSLMDDVYIVSTMLKTDPRNLKMWGGFKESDSALRKAMDTETVAEGSEWVPTYLSRELIEKFRLESKVAGLFKDIPMPSNPYDIPLLTGAITYYLIPESTSDEPSKPTPSTAGTGKRTLTAGKLKARVLFSDELTEGSIVPILPTLKEELILSGAEALENVILNADTDTVTPMDYDITDPRDQRRIFKGIRALFEASAATVIDASTFTITKFRAITTAMKKWGLNPSKLAIIAGVSTYNDLRGLAEVITLDKYGDRAVIFTGEIAKLDGSSIITSEKIREDLHTTAYCDQAARVLSELIVVYVPGIILGTWGTPKLKFLDDDIVDQNQLVVSFKKALVDRWDITVAGNEFIGVGGNL